MTRYRIKTEKLPYSPAFTGDVLTWAIVGVLLGGRLGYLLFYSFPAVCCQSSRLDHSFQFFRRKLQFSGIAGMSYHGGAIGVFLQYGFSPETRTNLFCKLSTFSSSRFRWATCSARLGNFINGELYGRVTDAAIGMYFPMAPGDSLRHPSQLYEAFFEGIFLFVILWALRKRAPYPGFLSGLYLIGYGVVRFFIEFYREPVRHLGFIFMQLSMGQLLCLAMIAGGIGVIAVSSKLGNKQEESRKQKDPAIETGEIKSRTCVTLLTGYLLTATTPRLCRSSVS